MPLSSAGFSPEGSLFHWNAFPVGQSESSSAESCENQSSLLVSEVSEALGLQLDSDLSCDERSLVAGDLERALQLRIEAPGGSYFDKAFSGTDQSDLIRYLRKRVRYVLSESTDVNARLSLDEGERVPFSRSADQSGSSYGQVYLVALNIGTALWFDSLTEGNSRVSLSVNGHGVPIDSSRVGIIQLGNGYTLQDERTGKYAFSPIVRISTFVHEARHSDCTGGVSPPDLSCIRNGALPRNLECGHLHVTCPAGHPYAGITACDDSPWGAYSIQAVFDATLEKYCANCSLTERLEARAVALDAIERVLIAQPMLDGQYGDPDMRSEGLKEQ